MYCGKINKNSTFKNITRRSQPCSCQGQTSKGEKSTISILESLNYKFEREFIFRDLFIIKGCYLRFDFAVFKNEQLSYLIEYDGELHYTTRRKSLEERDLLLLKKRQNYDEIKWNYCKANNIPLLIIPYWKKNKIQEEIEKFERLLTSLVTNRSMMIDDH